jgi:ubiquinone/menaquinone biosynthesis C-methylase UbiE
MLIMRLMRVFFDLLYHPFAFTYDLVAALVSLGRWNDWGMAILPYVKGRRVLEIGHGPGHLQLTLRERGLAVLGLDESSQMGKIARKRIRQFGYPGLNLTRGLAQALPFTSGSIDSIVSTFPSEYIFDFRTLSEVRRVLIDGGRLVVLPIAWHIGRRLVERFLAWAFRFTGEAPAISDMIENRLAAPVEKAGFQVEVHKIEVKSSLILILVATRST